MNKDPDDILIRDMFDAVSTPYYDVSSKVLNRIRTTPQKKVLLSKMVVAVATLCVIIAFFGTVKLIRSQFSNPDINEYAPISNQLISGKGIWNGGTSGDERENWSAYVTLRGLSKGNDGLSTVYSTLN